MRRNAMLISPNKTKRYLIPLMAALMFWAVGAGAALAQTFAPAPSPAPTPAAGSSQSGGGSTAQPSSDTSVGTALTDPYTGMAANKVYTGEKITLDFQNADIHNILRLIGEVSGKNVVVSDAVSGKVTLKLKSVPWDQALDIVLAARNLGKVENGNVLLIDSQEAIRRSIPDTSDPNTRVPLQTKYYTPKYSSVGTLAAELEKAKSPRGRVWVIGNDIYVEDDQKTLDDISLIFARNDRVTKQILIEARIVETDSSLLRNIGVSWGGGYDRDGQIATKNGTADAAALASQNRQGKAAHYGAIDSTSGALALGYGFLNKSHTLLLNAHLNASETVGETRTISAPRIMASNDQPVSIKQGTKIPYTTGGTATTEASTQFEDADMELKVTPHIEENGEIITLDIELTKDSVQAGGSSGSAPAIATKEAKTKLMVKNGETVVIGGIVVDTNDNTNTQVPGLSRVPLLGWLFKTSRINNSKAELLIFITANIVPITL
jgi:type IV pilus assembly protein PilQ